MSHSDDPNRHFVFLDSLIVLYSNIFIQIVTLGLDIIVVHVCVTLDVNIFMSLECHCDYDLVFPYNLNKYKFFCRKFLSLCWYLSGFHDYSFKNNPELSRECMKINSFKYSTNYFSGLSSNQNTWVCWFFHPSSLICFVFIVLFFPINQNSK